MSLKGLKVGACKYSYKNRSLDHLERTLKPVFMQTLGLGVQEPRGLLHRVRFDLLRSLPECRALRRSASRNRFSYHISSHVGETLVAAVVTERQSCVVETEQMQKGRVDVVHVRFFRLGAQAHGVS